jgi:hypothetical protein
MASVYVETTIPSYLAAKSSRDLIAAAHQQITHEWWANAKDRFDLYVSEAVLGEIRRGDANYAARRLEIVAEMDVLALSTDVEQLIHEYSQRLGLIGPAASDVPHFAFAVAYNIDYLVTWNCKHIANGQVIKRLTTVNESIDRRTPVICTPEELLAELPGDEP